LAYHWPDEEPLTVSLDDFIEQDKTVALEVKVSSYTSETNFATNNSTSVFVIQSQDYFSNYASIPLEIRESLLMGLEYFPSAFDKQDSSISKLKQILKSDKSITWIEYGNSLTVAI